MLGQQIFLFILLIKLAHSLAEEQMNFHESTVLSHNCLCNCNMQSRRISFNGGVAPVRKNQCYMLWIDGLVTQWVYTHWHYSTLLWVSFESMEYTPYMVSLEVYWSAMKTEFWSLPGASPVWSRVDREPFLDSTSSVQNLYYRVCSADSLQAGPPTGNGLYLGCTIL